MVAYIARDLSVSALAPLFFLWAIGTARAYLSCDVVVGSFGSRRARSARNREIQIRGNWEFIRGGCAKKPLFCEIIFVERYSRSSFWAVHEFRNRGGDACWVKMDSFAWKEYSMDDLESSRSINCRQQHFLSNGASVACRLQNLVLSW